MRVLAQYRHKRRQNAPLSRAGFMSVESVRRTVRALQVDASGSSKAKRYYHLDQLRQRRRLCCRRRMTELTDEGEPASPPARKRGDFARALAALVCDSAVNMGHSQQTLFFKSKNA